jgi:hypothetical protein
MYAVRLPAFKAPYPRESQDYKELQKTSRSLFMGGGCLKPKSQDRGVRILGYDPGGKRANRAALIPRRNNGDFMKTERSGSSH